MINKAIQFATVAHSNQTRKGTTIPYILHCLEAGTIAASLTNKDNQVDEDVVAAAILHDTMEDAFVTNETLTELFNENIANLVLSQTEDKTKSWNERKIDTIEFLERNESKDVEIATLADKLSNLRSINKDYQLMGEDLWSKFNAGYKEQKWYYTSIGLSLKQVTDTKEYREYVDLLDKTFS